jgi:hypothetical protein
MADVQLAIDPDSFTVGELVTIEEVIGTDEFVKLSEGKPSFKAVVAVAWIARRREKPDTTLEQIHAMSAPELQELVVKASGGE